MIRNMTLIFDEDILGKGRILAARRNRSLYPVHRDRASPQVLP